MLVKNLNMHRYLIVTAISVLLFGSGIVPAAEKSLLSLRLGEIFTPGPGRDLAHAAAKGDLEKIDVLIEEGTDVNGTGRAGLPILYWALHELNIEGFTALLKRGANPNHQWNTGSSVMHLSARLDRTDFLEIALKYGGNPDLRDPSGKATPLFSAISGTGEENIEILIKAGANINAQDGLGSTPAIKAANLNRYDLVLKLLKCGADYKLKNNWGVSLVDRLQAVKWTVDRESKEFYWRLEVADFLREKGVEVRLEATVK